MKHTLQHIQQRFNEQEILKFLFFGDINLLETEVLPKAVLVNGGNLSLP